MFVPSLTPKRVTTILCALVTPLRFTVTSCATDTGAAHAPDASGDTRARERDRGGKVQDQLIIVRRAAAAAFDASRAGQREVDVKVGSPVRLSRYGADRCERSAEFKRADVGGARAQVVTLILQRSVGSAGVDGRAARQQRMCEGRAAVILQRPEQWISVDLIAGAGQIIRPRRRCSGCSRAR